MTRGVRDETVWELTEQERRRQHHVELHRKLDELLAAFLADTKKLPSNTSIAELMEWSYQQTK
jgi:hypothetical protein